MSTPRKQRKALKIQCEKVETVLEEVDGELVGRLTTCDRAEIIQLSEKLGSLHALHALHADEVGVECMSIVEEALPELEQCGDAVTGASRQLASRDVNVRVSGVETLRDLQRNVLEKPVAEHLDVAQFYYSMRGYDMGSLAFQTYDDIGIGLRISKSSPYGILMQH